MWKKFVSVQSSKLNVIQRSIKLAWYQKLECRLECRQYVIQESIKSAWYQNLHSSAHGSGILVIPPFPNPIRGSTASKLKIHYVRIQVLCANTSTVYKYKYTSVNIQILELVSEYTANKNTIRVAKCHTFYTEQIFQTKFYPMKRQI